MICESTANRITNHARKANENDSFSILARVLCDFGASWEFTDNNNMILQLSSLDQIFVETPYSLQQSMTVKSNSLLLPTEAILVPATKVYIESTKETTVPHFAMLSS